MSSSQEVFELRREGSLDEAYKMALEVIATNPNDDWNIKALAWCLYDLIKKSSSQNKYSDAKNYLVKLESLKIDPSDDILISCVKNAKVLADQNKKIILDAKEKSKKGEHKEALKLFRLAIKAFPDDIDLNNQYAWEIQKEVKVIANEKKINSFELKKLFAEYIKLKNERPSQLHSLFLFYANKIKDSEDFNFISFLKLWDLKNLRGEDFQPNHFEGKTYPSLAEKIVQHSFKIILNKNLYTEVDYFIPFLEEAIDRFPENIWLTYYKAKILHQLNRNDEALGFLIPVVKEKITEYWTWSLLAEIINDKDAEKSFSCYCKALLCNGEEKFTVNVRLKLAEMLIKKNLWNEAKHEISTVVKIKEKDGIKLSEQLIDWQNSDWYGNSIERSSNVDFYNSNKNMAEEILLDSMPWLETCIGDTFVIPDKPDKPRRKLYIKLNYEIIEAKISDNKYDIKNKYSYGDAIKIKGEYNKSNIFNVFSIEDRKSSEKWDIFKWRTGNLVNFYINQKDNEKYWRISFIEFSEFKEGIIKEKHLQINSDLKEGMAVSVKCFKSESKNNDVSLYKRKEAKYYILSLKERSDGFLWDSFNEFIGIIDHINEEKRIVHFIVNKDIVGIIKLDQFNIPAELGSKVLLKVQKVKKDRDSYYNVLTCQKTDLEAAEELLRPFSGSIELAGSAGFADDVYIERTFLDLHDIHEEDWVNGTAILNYNKKRNKWGWKALKIDKVYKIDRMEDTEEYS